MIICEDFCKEDRFFLIFHIFIKLFKSIKGNLSSLTILYLTATFFFQIKLFKASLTIFDFSNKLISIFLTKYFSA
jgi:hypothetical protein